MDSIIPNLTQLRNSLEDLLIQHKRIADALDVMVAPQREKLAAERAEAEEAERQQKLAEATAKKWNEFLKYLKAWLPKEVFRCILLMFREAEISDEETLYSGYVYLRPDGFASRRSPEEKLVRRSLRDLRRAAKSFFGKPLKA